MEHNLLALYDLVSRHILEYGYFKPPIFSEEFMSAKMFFKHWKELLDDPFSERRPEIFRKHFNAMATKEQRDNKYFRVFQSEYPLDALCEQIEMDFPDVDFSRLAALNRLRKKDLSDRRAFKFKEKFGIALGATTLILQNVPKVVVEKLFDYDSYQIGIFYIMIGVLVYLCLIFLLLRPISGKLSGDLQRLNYIEKVLEYGSLRKNQKLPNKGVE